MNILQLSKYYFPYPGGIESVVRELVIGLKSRRNLSVTVGASNDKDNFSKEEIDQALITRLPQHLKLFSQPFSFSLITELRALLHGKDIVHLHTPNPLWELVIFFLLRKNQIWIITHHSDIVNQKYLAPFVFFLQRFIYKRVDAFIIPTENHLKYSKILTHFQNSCHLIPFAFRFEEILAFKPNLSQLEQIKKKYSHYAIFIGRLVPYKGLNVLIEAMKIIDKKYQLVVIGEGPQKDFLQNSANHFALKDRVHFLGKLPYEELYHYLFAAEFLVLPSLNQSENFGIVQLEAFAMKKSVIVSNLKSGASSLVIDQENGLLAEPGNARDFASKMEKLFDSPDRAIEMGEKAFAHLKKYYSFEMMVDAHEKLYTNLLEHKGKG